MRAPGVVTAWVCMLATHVGCGDVAATCASDVDLQTSHDHCGACELACAADEVCEAGTCVGCPADQARCGASCVATETDVTNCGGCGTACNTGESCVAGKCQAPCDATKLAPSAITDPWGLAWDSDQRAPASLNTAQVTCKAFGARLPTPTELYRVSATQSAAVGMSFDVDPLWTQAPDDKLNQAMIRLSDGATSTLAAASPAPYRCVCPTVMTRTFSGAHCHGKPGSECFAVGTTHIDSADRPALRRSAAVWECTNERAHLAELATLAEAIQAGLPGSGKLIATADASDNHQSTEIRWTAMPWVAAGNVAAIDLRTPAPFRCAGTSLDVPPNPNLVANQFVAPLSRTKGETTDRAAAAWAAAHDACSARGGHLPRAGELAELIQQGLPDGTGKTLWTTDEVGYDGANQFQAAVVSWTGVDARYSYAFGGTDQTTTFVFKTTMQPFRCIFYPIDVSYVAPTACNGGCFALVRAGDPVATMWFDSRDRAAKLLGEAFADCASAGGHVSSERDLTEAIRAGLPNGVGGATYVHTSDLGRLMNMIVRWAGTGNTMYADQYATSMTWSALTAVRPYRCMWTNELR